MKRTHEKASFLDFSLSAYFSYLFALFYTLYFLENDLMFIFIRMYHLMVMF